MDHDEYDTSQNDVFRSGLCEKRKCMDTERGAGLLKGIPSFNIWAPKSLQTINNAQFVEYHPAFHIFRNTKNTKSSMTGTSLTTSLTFLVFEEPKME